MINVLFDSDLVLDIILERMPFYTDSAAVWQAYENGQVEAGITSSTVLNAYYITRKYKSAATAKRAVHELLLAITVYPVTRADLQKADAADWSDFEDAVQHEVAVANGLDGIVTRNTSDSRASKLPVFAPQDLLKRITTP